MLMCVCVCVCVCVFVLHKLSHLSSSHLVTAYIQAIMSMQQEVQHVVMGAIQDVSICTHNLLMSTIPAILCITYIRII